MTTGRAEAAALLPDEGDRRRRRPEGRQRPGEGEYDPATGRFAATGSLAIARWNPTGVVLDDGSLLIAGGYDSDGRPLDTAELYDPRRGASPRPDR